MCGFAGIIDFDQKTGEQDLRHNVEGMASTLRHRGPDDTGVWLDARAGVALGHRRLSILDLSPAGRQPMVSNSGRYVIAYNGEIYNFLDLRRHLEQANFNFRGHSDTEVMLAAFEHWGIQRAISRFNGMFAFALWDRSERVLFLSRDRLGEKPLYYGFSGRTFLFGSELKALQVHPDFRSEINRDALALYFRHNCIPAPYSIYKGIFKLPPATLLAISSNQADAAVPVPYWSLKEVVERGVGHPFSGSEAEALAECESLLRDAVRIRMVADVPLGAFLSGGIDSSTVVALMQAQSERPVKTFTIGFCEPDYNEAEHAAAIARHLETDHTELYVTPAETMAVIPKLANIYDEPFADSSQIPTFLVAQLTRQHVTVGLSGDGGDEVFGGYNRHVWNGRVWNTVKWMPQITRTVTAKAIQQIPPRKWEALWQALGAFLPAGARHRNIGYKLHKLAGILPASSPRAMYLALASHWQQPEAVVIGAKEPRTLFSRSDAWPSLAEFAQQMMFLDTATYLPDDILAKVDRATMGVSLEARVPMLDHRLVEFAWSLPSSLKIRNGQGKWILRQLLRRYVPSSLIDRPKAGFGIPLDNWLRGPLRDWAESLLEERRLRNDGFLDPALIRNKWKEHLAGEHAWQYHLWDALMFQAWYAAQQETELQLQIDAKTA